MELKLKETIIIILFVFVVLNYGLYNKYKKDDAIENNYKILDNSSTYYSIVNIVDNFIKKSNQENVDEIISLLDNKYKKENNISAHNVFDYINAYKDGQYSFSGDVIYELKLKDDISEFYVKGNIEKQTMDSSSSKVYYVILKLDKTNSTFSIIPDDGKKYKEATNGI